MPHLLLLARSPETRLELLQHLSHGDFTWTALDSPEGLDRLMTGSEAQAGFDAVILDLQPEFREGIRFLERLRSCTPTRNLPVLLLAASSRDLDKALGLDIHADDCVPRPVSPRELEARIHAVLRRAAWLREGTPAAILELAPLKADLERQEAFLGEERLDLTRREFELLAFLLQHPRQVLPRERILQQVWNLSYLGESRTIDAHVRRLRAKLKEAAHLIETVTGVGYRLGAVEDGRAKS